MIPTTDNVKTITDMRENALLLLRQVEKSKGPLYIFHRSQPKAVLLAIDQYKKLSDLLEDYLDSLKVQGYEKSVKKKWGGDSLSDLKKELGL
ncbi:type II toxin-antitoxin system Phd/YefM family antitoxin [Patescibacteria group bacterium]|nr:type II toxin-antitoxin system Phd/YefM family antitoxin [Patescibacteria group bacterium]